MVGRRERPNSRGRRAWLGFAAHRGKRCFTVDEMTHGAHMAQGHRIRIISARNLTRAEREEYEEGDFD